MTNVAANEPEFASAGQKVDEIPVSLNYDIIRLFSEGLYKSPHKAIEELVSNGYDAEAERVHILLPEEPEGEAGSLAPLWVIDDGHGMDVDGFRQLWRVAESNKNSPSPKGRAPIGQFGIGKLAAYVLAWKLTHVSRMDGRLLLTSMNFRDVKGRRQSEASDPIRVSLREVNETQAKSLLAEIEDRDPAAWKLMFDKEQQHPTWTAAALSDFKDLYHKLSIGRLRWVLSTGLPLHSDFSIRLNGERVRSSKENLPTLKTIVLGGDDDAVAGDLDEVERSNGGVKLPGIEEIRGEARIYRKQLSTGKAGEVGRSHGFSFACGAASSTWRTSCSASRPSTTPRGPASPWMSTPTACGITCFHPARASGIRTTSGGSGITFAASSTPAERPMKHGNGSRMRSWTSGGSCPKGRAPM